MKQYDWKNLKSFEPFWKLILGNKALLPLLWSMFPNNKYLLPAYYDAADLMKSDPKLQAEKWVSKPVFGREGMGVFFSSNFSNFNEFVKKTEQTFGKDSTGTQLGKAIYQQETELATTQGRVIQTSVWMIAGEASGLAFREGKAGHHFEDTNPFLVHIVETDSSSRPYIDYRRNKAQTVLINQIYGSNRQYNNYNNMGYRIIQHESELITSETWKKWQAYGEAKQRVENYRAAQRGIVLDDVEASYVRYKSLTTKDQSGFQIAKPKDL